jgi:hypothetical protein
MTKYQKQLIRREGLFWFSFRGFSPSTVGLIAFGPVIDEAVHHGGSAWQRSLFNSWWLGSKKRQEGARVPISLFKGMSSMT